MPAIHELYGLQSEELENLKLEYGKLLNLVSRLKSGEVDLDDVQVDGNSWTIDSPATTDVEPEV